MVPIVWQLLQYRREASPAVAADQTKPEQTISVLIKAA
jgi:hypothetical protein